MKKIVKKVITYSLLVGVMQFGISASVLEASPRKDQWQDQRQEQKHDQRHDQRQEQWQDHRQDQAQDREYREHQRHERQENERIYRENLENERHWREIQRRDYEDWQTWNDRCWQANQTHNQIIAQIAGDVVLLFLGE